MVLGRDNGSMAAGVDVGGIYVDNAARVRRLVRHNVRAPEPVIEDACQTAWTRLVRDRSRVCPDKAVPWLVTTAVREAVRLTRRGSREVFLEELLDDTRELHELATAPGPEETADHRAQLDAVRLLPERQQRLVWLQALGWSYTEMAEATGATTRTIDRQLVRARRRLAVSAQR
ncbi:MAG TPA: sigma-70 family RNA polymerase sigma factor [Solirubrobacteraceae bacterium]|nr:sigma-70 family RNA polymerase sigma factor [Solirubrobacteraceae bacterium]